MKVILFKKIAKWSLHRTIHAHETRTSYIGLFHIFEVAFPCRYVNATFNVEPISANTAKSHHSR